MANIGKSVKLGVFTLAIMNVTAVVSLRFKQSALRIPDLLKQLPFVELIPCVALVIFLQQHPV